MTNHQTRCTKPIQLEKCKCEWNTELGNIYEEIKQIELDGHITGHRAKKVIKLSNRALEIIHQYMETAHLEKDMKELIKELEDDLATNNKLSSIGLNLGVRGKIHVAFLYGHRYLKKEYDDKCEVKF